MSILTFIMNTIGIGFDALQKRLGVQKMAYIFVLPNMLLFAIFSLLPILLNFYYAFTGGGKPLPKDRWFVGGENFNILSQCSNYLNPNSCTVDLFWRGVNNTIFYVVFEVAGLLFFSILTALILNRKIVGRGFFRSVFFYPVLLSPVVIALLWRWILQKEGLLNAGLGYMGIEPINFLLEVGWARFWTIAIGIWAYMGFYTLIVLAGLQSIPADIYEAAKIDGANDWAGFRHITLPLLQPTLLVVFILAFIRSVQVFDHVFVLTGGGPGTATQYIMQFIYNVGFSTDTRNYGLAAAASICIGIALAILTAIQLRLSRT